MKSIPRSHAFLAALLSLALARSLPAAEHNQLTSDELSDGWIRLFDGETLFGMTPANKADWKVVDGAITVTTGDQGLLNTNAQFADYVLKADFRTGNIEKGTATNSGIFLRTKRAPSDPKDACYELNIAPFDSTPFPTGSLVARKKADGNHDSADWQTFEVTCEKDRIRVKIGDRQVLDYIDPNPTLRGHIGLQLNKGKVEFRNVKLKPLGLKSLLNGKDLSGWESHPELKNVFSVNSDGHLQVKGGKGQLECDQEFGDFVLQLEAKSNREGSNSGLFYRSIPGEQMNGYECQLQHRYGGDGKPNPVDCGTGGICRRQIARKIVAKDNEWFYLTLVVSGAHTAAWVNGYQVTDFLDERKDHKNPRNGRRLTPGTLILQAHDDTTDFTFRRIAAVEMPSAPAEKAAR